MRFDLTRPNPVEQEPERVLNVWLEVDKSNSFIEGVAGRLEVRVSDGKHSVVAFTICPNGQATINAAGLSYLGIAAHV